MKPTWSRENEYSDLYQTAEFQRENDLDAARGIVNGLLIVIAFCLMVFVAWIYGKFFS